MIQMKVILVFSSIVSLVCGDFKLRLLHTNDMHSRWTGIDANGGPIEKYETAEYGGVLRVKAKEKEVRDATPSDRNVLFLNGGDSFQGSPWFVVVRDTLGDADIMSAQFVQAMGFDALSPGNHEFDLGLKGFNRYYDIAGFNVNPRRKYLRDEWNDCDSTLDQLLEDESEWAEINFNTLTDDDLDSKVPILIAANVIVAQNSPAYGKLKKSVIRMYESNGKIVPVGIIGYLTNEVTGTLETNSGIKIGSEVAYVGKEARRLNAMGVKVIIAVGHSGFEIDQELAALDYIDVVIGGHTNTFMYNDYDGTFLQPEAKTGEKFPSYPLMVKKTKRTMGLTPVIQSFAFTKYLGKLDLDFDDNGKLKLDSHFSLKRGLATFTKAKQNPILLNDRVAVRNGRILFYSNPNSVQLANQNLENMLKDWTAKFEQNRPFRDPIGTNGFGKIYSYLEGGDPCRKAECELGGVVADSQIAWFGANNPVIKLNDYKELIGVIGSGAVRTSIGDIFVSSRKPKSVTAWDIMGVLAFNNRLGIIRLPRDTVLALFQYAISEWKLNDPSGKLLQVSHNLRVTYDFNKIQNQLPFVKVEVYDGKVYADISSPEFSDTFFNVVTTDRLANGKDGYTMVKKEFIITPLETGKQGWDVLGSYVKNMDRSITNRILYVNKD